MGNSPRQTAVVQTAVVVVESELSSTTSTTSVSSSTSAGGGDPQLARWLDEHGEALYRFAIQKVGDEHLVADLLQETFLAALQGFDRFRGDSQVRTWLISILRLKIIDLHRLNQRQQRLLQQLPERSQSTPFRQRRLEAWPSGADEVADQEFLEVLQRCLEKLPAALAKAFLLRELDGHTVADVCQLLGIKSKNLAVRLFRARSGLRDCLDENWFEEN